MGQKKSQSMESPISQQNLVSTGLKGYVGMPTLLGTVIMLQGRNLINVRTVDYMKINIYVWSAS